MELVLSVGGRRERAVELKHGNYQFTSCTAIAVLPVLLL